MAIDKKLALGIVSCLGHSWPEKVFCDITVAIDGQEFNCHRFHLSACSKFFRVLLGSNLSLDYLIIKGIRPDIFELILDSIYKGENRITADNMIDLWYAANQLEIRFLLQEIENFIILNTSVDNYLHIFDVAHDLKADRVLSGICQAFIVNWEKFRQDQRFLTLSCEELQTILQNATTISSDELVESILMWTNYEFTAPIKNNIQNFPFSKEIDDVNKFVEVTLKSIVNLEIGDRIIHYKHQTSIHRKEIIGKLLKNVKLDLISQQGLKKLLCDDTVMDCKEARDLVRQALASSLERSDTKTSQWNESKVMATASVTETTQSNESKVMAAASVTESSQSNESKVMAAASVTETSQSNELKEMATLTARVDGLLPTALFFKGSLELSAFSFSSNKFYSVKLIINKRCDGKVSVIDFGMIENKLYVVINYHISSVPYRAIELIPRTGPVKTFVFIRQLTGNVLQVVENSCTDLFTISGV